MNNNVIDNIILAQADRLSAQGPDVTKEMTDAKTKYQSEKGNKK